MIRCVILDLDGTLYRGDEVMPNAVASVNLLVKHDIQVRYLTNNSGKTVQQQSEKLTNMGFLAPPNWIYTTATGAVDHLVKLGRNRVFVVGENGLVDTIRSASIQAWTIEEDTEHSQPPDAVLVGICRSFTYRWMALAMEYIRNGAEFIATNRDPMYPLANNQFEPGTGSIVAAIETCTGQTPFVIGKPEPFLIETILGDCHMSPEQTLIVGDRLDTDIASGLAANCHVHLVLSGVETVAPAHVPSSPDLLAVADRVLGQSS